MPVSHTHSHAGASPLETGRSFKIFNRGTTALLGAGAAVLAIAVGNLDPNAGETREKRDAFAVEKAREAQTAKAQLGEGLIGEKLDARGLIVNPVEGTYEFTRTVAERDEVCRGSYEVADRVAAMVGPMACETTK